MDVPVGYSWPEALRHYYIVLIVEEIAFYGQQHCALVCFDLIVLSFCAALFKIGLCMFKTDILLEKRLQQ